MYKPDTKTKRVMDYLNNDRFTPSEIDKVMKMPPGTAHDIIVDHWAAIKASYSNTETLFD